MMKWINKFLINQYQTLFNIYIDSLLHTLARLNLKPLAFADDIAFVALGTMQLIQGIKAAEGWSTDFGISLNREKSGILCVRADLRTPAPSYLSVRNIPIVRHYKYLGVTIDDCGDFKP